ncbi:uncharacterized protein LOC143026916 [Oratosquilla oratoria]|uniref:uncharacterized protein LOC143026916 n=1 Tax=Oratosquilla oratoria TaxID=337810 RepID=UPI003F76B931
MCRVNFLVLLAAVYVHGAKFLPPYSERLSQGSASPDVFLPTTGTQSQGPQTGSGSRGSQFPRVFQHGIPSSRPGPSVTGPDGPVFGNPDILTRESGVGNVFSRQSSHQVPVQFEQDSSDQRTQLQFSVTSLTNAILRALGSVGRHIKMSPPVTRTVTVTSLVNVQETRTILATSLLVVTSHVTVSNTVTTRVFKQSEPETKTRKMTITATSVNFVTETSAIHTFLTATATQTRYVYTPELKTFHTTRTHNLLSYASTVERVFETQTLGVKNSDTFTTTAYVTRTFYTTLVAPTNVYN